MKLGCYELETLESERIDWFHPSERVRMHTDMIIVGIDESTGPWELKVCLPIDRAVSGAVSLHRPLTLAGPLSQIATKSMKISPVASEEGAYISELKVCTPDNAGRIRCHQVRVEDAMPSHFLESGIAAVEYADYVEGSRANFAMGWLYDENEAEKMALCFYLSRIFPSIERVTLVGRFE